MADSTYELTRSARRAPLWFVGALAGAVMFVALTGLGLDRASVVGLSLYCAVMLSFVGYDLVWRPHRVVLTEAGVVVTSRARQVAIPWVELVSVTRIPLGRHKVLEWRRARGRVVRIDDDFVDVHRLLGEVESRAPHVLVSS